MNLYELPELQRLYFSQSRYSAPEPARPYDSLLQWPSSGYFDVFRPDANLLKEALTSYDKPETRSLADEVFGSQARQQRLGLKHLANLLYERSVLHAGHLKEIDRRHLKCQETLSILKMHHPIDGGRKEQNLERLIVGLEEERRKEELDFWKDLTEIRAKMFEQGAEYQATRHRIGMFAGVEE